MVIAILVTYFCMWLICEFLGLIGMVEIYDTGGRIAEVVIILLFGTPLSFMAYGMFGAAIGSSYASYKDGVVSL